MAHVKFEVEIGVFYPVRMIETQRHSRNALAKRTRLVQTLLEELEDLFERDPPTGRGTLIVDRQTADVHGRRSRL